MKIDQKSALDLKHSATICRNTNQSSEPLDSQRLSFLFAELEADIVHLDELLTEISALMLFECEDRELITQTSVNLSAIRRVCRRRKLDDWC